MTIFWLFLPLIRQMFLYLYNNQIQEEDTCYVTSDDNDNEDTNDDDHISDNKLIYMKDPNYFDTLIDNVDLFYIEREEEPI